MSTILSLKQATKIIHRYPVNLDSRDIIDFSDEQSYSTNDVYLKSLGRVWLSSDSVVYKNGIVVPDTLTSRKQRSYYQVRHLARKLITGRSILLNDKKIPARHRQLVFGPFSLVLRGIAEVILLKGSNKTIFTAAARYFLYPDNRGGKLNNAGFGVY